MEYNNLGKSGLQISRLSLETWLTFGKQKKKKLKRQKKKK